MTSQIAAPDAAHHTDAGVSGFTSELKWLVPLGVALFALTAFLLFMGRDGGDVANVLSLSVSAAALVTAILIYRLDHPRPTPTSGGRKPHSLWSLLAAILVTALVSSTASVIFVTTVLHTSPKCSDAGRRDTANYLSGTVNVGVNGRLPGWSLSPEDSNGHQWSGFDTDFARFLARKHGFTVNFISLKPGEREQALKTCEVQLVLANYSITISREESIDFAGPYFLDHSGLLYSEEKSRKEQSTDGIPVSKVCVTEGTTASEYLGSGGTPVTAPSLPDCIAKYFDPDNDVLGIVTDETILKAYAKYRGTPDDAMPAIWQGEHTAMHDESYGIGIPNNSPELCRVLSHDIDDFLAGGWSDDFNANLASSQDMSGHRPSGSDRSHCG